MTTRTYGLRFSDVNEFVKDGLVALGYGKTQPNVGEPLRPLPLIDPGPGTLAALHKKSAGTMVFITVGNGVGLTQEGLYDQVFLTVRVIGLQNNFPSAEDLALDVDRILLGVESNRVLGQTLVLGINRTAGSPQLVDFDNATRYHFQATYVVTAKTGLDNT